MPLDREDTLKKAEKLLRTGRLEAAIAEYAKVVEAQPDDWNTTNTLGDLYVRAGQSDRAAAQYSRIAGHFMREGFFPKASAIYKKLLKLNPEDEVSQLALAELSQQQGLLADAKAHLNAVAARRRKRGDKAGAAEIVVRLGSVDPADFEARATAARTLVEMGNEEAAAQGYRAMYEDLLEKDREQEALEALREAVRLNPYDRDGRILLAKAAIAQGDPSGARAYLDRETAGGDPALLAAVLENELRSGELEAAREVVPVLLAAHGRDGRRIVTDLAWSMLESAPEGAFVLVDAAADWAAARGEYGDAAALLQEFTARVPRHIAALNKLIEVSVDGGLEAPMFEAQASLADAYLQTGQGTEARAVAEDLVAREPWERAHIDRFRRALVMLKVSDPDTVIADRLSGQAPFMFTDPFPARASASAPDTSAVDAGSTASAGRGGGEARRAIGEADEVLPGSSAPDTAGEGGAVAPAPRRASIPLSRAPAPVEGEGEIDLTAALGGSGTRTVPADDEQPARREDPGDAGGSRPGGGDGADQSAEYMALALTYLGMDLEDEAVRSLEIAARSPRFRFDAASRLGRILAGRGETSRAIEYLERAAEAPAPTPDDSRALLYDLGSLVEQHGDTSRALAIFLELQAEAGDYRDVGERVERLTRVETGG